MDFIIYSNNPKIKKYTQDFVDDCELFDDLNYNIFMFDKLEKLETVIKTKGNKIYILSINDDLVEAVNLATLIRKNDYKSIIIFVTNKESTINRIAKMRLMFLTIVTQYDNFINNLNIAIEKAIEILNNRSNILIKDKNRMYLVSKENLLYITSESKKTKIVLDSKIIYTTITAKSIAMNHDFLIKTHRSYYVNKERIKEFNFDKGEALFDNDLILKCISNDEKKNIKELFKF